MVLLYIYTPNTCCIWQVGGGGITDDKSESQAYELADMFMGTER